MNISPVGVFSNFKATNCNNFKKTNPILYKNNIQDTFTFTGNKTYKTPAYTEKPKINSLKILEKYDGDIKPFEKEMLRNLDMDANLWMDNIEEGVSAAAGLRDSAQKTYEYVKNGNIKGGCSISMRNKDGDYIKIPRNEGYLVGENKFVYNASGNVTEINQIYSFDKNTTTVRNYSYDPNSGKLTKYSEELHDNANNEILLFGSYEIDDKDPNTVHINQCKKSFYANNPPRVTVTYDPKDDSNATYIKYIRYGSYGQTMEVEKRIRKIDDEKINISYTCKNGNDINAFSKALVLKH